MYFARRKNPKHMMMARLEYIAKELAIGSTPSFAKLIPAVIRNAAAPVGACRLWFSGLRFFNKGCRYG